jgi:hypothetical protein
VANERAFISRGFDHIVHAVRDLDAAKLYRGLGFTVGARLAAQRFATDDASLPQDVSEFAGMAGFYTGNPAVIGADDAMGAVLVFKSA